MLLAAAEAFALTEAAQKQATELKVAFDSATLTETLTLAAAALAQDNAAASEVATIAALLTTRTDEFTFDDVSTLSTIEFVEILSALVTAAVTIQSVTNVITDEPTGGARLVIDVPGSGTSSPDMPGAANTEVD